MFVCVCILVCAYACAFTLSARVGMCVPYACARACAYLCVERGPLCGERPDSLPERRAHVFLPLLPPFPRLPQGLNLLLSPLEVPEVVPCECPPHKLIVRLAPVQRVNHEREPQLRAD